MPPTVVPAAGSQPPRDFRVAWDWVDVVFFMTGGFLIGAYVGGVILSAPVADAIIATLRGRLSSEAQQAVRSFVIQGGTYAGAIAVLIGLLRVRHRTSLRDLGWRWPARRWLPIAVLTFIATLGLAALLVVVSDRIFPNAPATQCTTVRQDYGHLLAVAIPAVSIIAPLAEETVFRGFIYAWMRSHLPLVPAVLLSAALFAAAHLQLSLFLPLIGVGSVLALLYERSRSLLPGAIVHGLFNLFGIVSILTAPGCS